MLEEQRVMRETASQSARLQRFVSSDALLARSRVVFTPHVAFNRHANKTGVFFTYPQNR